MIIGDITLQQIDGLYQGAGIKELFVLPWYDWQPGDGWASPGALVGLITGAIEEYPEYPGKSGFLEHFIVLPNIPGKLRLKTMLDMPKAAATILRARGIARILLCIDQSNPKRVGLDAWARRCGYTKYAEKEGRDWYVNPLT